VTHGESRGSGVLFSLLVWLFSVTNHVIWLFEGMPSGNVSTCLLGQLQLFIVHIQRCRPFGRTVRGDVFCSGLFDG